MAAKAVVMWVAYLLTQLHLQSTNQTLLDIALHRSQETLELNRPPNRKSTPRVPGQATIELALVLIFLLIPLLIGLAEIVRAYHEHLAVVHAANVSARWATLTSSQQYCSGYQSVATAVAADLANVPVQIKAVTTAVTQGTPGPLVAVTVAYSHTLFFGLVDSSMVFTGSAAMPGTASTPVSCLSCCPTPMGTPVPSATPTLTPTNTPIAGILPVTALHSKAGTACRVEDNAATSYRELCATFPVQCRPTGEARS